MQILANDISRCDNADCLSRMECVRYLSWTQTCFAAKNYFGIDDIEVLKSEIPVTRFEPNKETGICINQIHK